MQWRIGRPCIWNADLVIVAIDNTGWFAAVMIPVHVLSPHGINALLAKDTGSRRLARTYIPNYRETRMNFRDCLRIHQTLSRVQGLCPLVQQAENPFQGSQASCASAGKNSFCWEAEIHLHSVEIWSRYCAFPQSNLLGGSPWAPCAFSSSQSLS